MITVFFIYGLAFFSLGMAVLLYPKEASTHRLSQSIWLVAAFGLLHGANEWLDMFILISDGGTVAMLVFVRAIVSPASFICLLVFGIRTMKEFGRCGAWIGFVGPGLVLLWLVALAMGKDSFLYADIFGRYLLGLPGIWLTAYGFLLYKRSLIRAEDVRKSLNIVILAFALYGFFAGLVVKGADFFPASVLNYENFIAVTGLPVQIFRAACAILAAYGIINTLKVFDLEKKEALAQARDWLELRVSERTAELKQLNERLESEILERKSAETQIRAALMDKEVLLKELHHRVKNNMQVISSMLKMTTRYGGGKSLHGIIDECQNRIKSMSLVHEQLYISSDLTSIAVRPFLDKLFQQIMRSYSSMAQRVRFRSDISDISLDIDTASPIGLLVNELVSNSLEHAFPGLREGTITLRFLKLPDGSFELTVSDNGVGLPEGFRPEKSETIGMHLVYSLIEQLHAKTEVISEGQGTTFRLVFHELRYARRI